MIAAATRARQCSDCLLTKVESEFAQGLPLCKLCEGNRRRFRAAMEKEGMYDKRDDRDDRFKKDAKDDETEFIDDHITDLYEMVRDGIKTRDQPLARRAIATMIWPHLHRHRKALEAVSACLVLTCAMGCSTARVGDPPMPLAETVASDFGIQWIMPVTNCDGSPVDDLAGSWVYRATDLVAADWTRAAWIAETAPGATVLWSEVEFSDHAFYAVSAVDQAGNESPRAWLGEQCE